MPEPVSVTADDYCAGELRRYDHDRYLTCLFAPEAKRAHLFALYAFNLELAKTAEIVSEEMLGEIRLQWWREALEGIYAGRPRQHAVVEALASAVAAGGLTQAQLLRIIDARAFDLAQRAPRDLAELESYAADTSGALVRAALTILGSADSRLQEAAGKVGTAWALTGLLRSVPFHARQKRLYLPQDRIAASGLRQGDLFELRSSPALQQVVAEVASRAERILGEAEAAAVPGRRVLPAFLTGTLCRHDLKRLAAAGHDPFAPPLQAPTPGRAWRLTWASLRGRF